MLALKQEDELNDFENQTQEMSQGLARQRRNLILISILIIIFAEGGVVIEDFSLAGLKLKFKDFRIVYISLWIMFTYFFIRYYQYFKEEPDLGVEKAFWRKLNERCWEKIKSNSIKACPNCEEFGGQFSFSATKSSSFIRRRVRVVTSRSTYGEDNNEEIEISVIPFIPDIIASLFHVLANRKGFSDYFFPFIISLWSLTYSVNELWEGSVLNIIRQG